MERFTGEDGSHSIVENTMGEIRKLPDSKRQKIVTDLLRVALDKFETTGYMEDQELFSSEVSPLTSGLIRHDIN